MKILNWGLLTLLALPLVAEAPNGADILKQVDAIRFPETFTMQVTLTTSAPSEADKVMVMVNSHKKGLGTFIEILAPARSKGTKMLTQEGSLWMFNPKSGSNKPLRLAPKDSFQGSSFSNSDVSKTSFTEEYAAVNEGEDTVETAEFGTVKAWRIRADSTSPEAAYGKIVQWVRQGDLLPLKFDYYAKSGLLFRQMTLSAYKTMAGRLRATRLEMTSLDKKGTKTVLTIDSMDAKDLPDSLFNLTNLTK